MKIDPKKHGHSAFDSNITDIATPMQENRDPTGGDPVVKSIFQMVDDFGAKSARVASRGTRMSPPPGSADVPTNVAPPRRGGKR
jgi:hypothetical protein